ncbi:MAG TPA: hypothetical protein VHW23_27725 [Kofleriaceae bacterium]|jgi:hypothetical protein|nr:hypothetical protein [Kofleriaceae bacterium]
MRKHLLTIVVFGLVVTARATPARADVGLGVFLGEPTGLDLKVGLGYRSGLDFVLGFTRLSSNANGYGHVTYLITPLIAQGDAVTVPIRFGIGGALFGPGDDLSLAVRAPFEVGVRLRRSPLEFYGEIALAFVFINPPGDPELDVQGGGGFRVYF